MMFVVSDGRYDQSQLSALRRLHRRLAERKRLLVLLIVDGDPARSIDKERRILFEPNGEIKNLAYLEDYPFPYYVVLKDIAKLPEVLSDALRQWFELLHQNQ
jgi:midasin